MSFKFVSLNNNGIEYLATALHLEESEAIRAKSFFSDAECVFYFNDSEMAQSYVSHFMTAAAELDAKFRGSGNPNTFIVYYKAYIKSILNVALQALRNHTARKFILQKFREQMDSVGYTVSKLETEHHTHERDDITHDVNSYRKSMDNYIANYNNSNVAEFSQSVKKAGLTFQDLVVRYQTKNGYEGNFKDLGNVQKLKVYETIISKSGIDKIFETDFKSTIDIGFLVILAGMMVWNIFSLGHIIGDGARAAVDGVTASGSATLNDVVGAITSAATAQGGTIEANKVIALATGVINGINGAYIVGSFVGPFLDSFFGSGGADFSTDGIICHSVELLLNGAESANELWKDYH